MTIEIWIEQQIDALITLGFTPADAFTAVMAAIAQMPPGANPDEYIPPIATIQVDADDIEDARVSWYETAPDKVKRLLDALEVSDD